MERQRQKARICSAAAGLPAVVFLMVLILSPRAAWGQDNPFFGQSGGGQPGEGRAEKAAPAEEDGAGSAEKNGGGEQVDRRGGRLRLPRGRIFRALSAVQRGLNERINSFALRIKGGEGIGVAAALLALSFVYGLIHALGPGHRKIILTSYFLQAEVTPLAGIGTALGIAMVHGIAALVLMSVLYFLLHVTVSQTFNAAYLLMERISYGLIVGLGGYLVVHAVLEARDNRKGEEGQRTAGAAPGKGGAEQRSSDEAGGGSGNGATDPAACGAAGKKRKPENAMFIISSGIVPCPGASLLLIFLFAQRLYAVGVLSVFTMSLGMGVTLAAVAVSVLFAKEKGLKRVLGRHGKGAKVLSGLEIGGSVLVLLFGTVLLLSVL